MSPFEQQRGAPRAGLGSGRLLSGRAVASGSAWRKATGAALAALLVGVLGVALSQARLFWRPESERLGDYAQRYAGSIAFVTVEYWLKNAGDESCHTISFGTAFLADRSGHLLTSRHVVCPWLSDVSFAASAEAALESQGCPEFGYRMWVWFDGAKALRPLREVFSDPRLDDLFYADSAYRTDGAPTVSVVGVLPVPTDPAQAAEKPLEDDVAVLQLAPVPRGREPLPLASAQAAQPARLAPLIALGYPMGIDTMPFKELAVSATMGRVRRCFPNLIQTDVSLHSGNSGGPVLNAKGRVIGIASSVYREEGFLFSSPQSDMGQILPVACGEALLQSVTSGKMQWDGLVDPALDLKMAHLLEQARQGDRHGACQAERAMKGLFPQRLLVGAALHYGDGNEAEALARLRMLQAVHPDHHEAAFMNLLLMRKSRKAFETAAAGKLMSLDWRADGEFYGYLARVLAGKVPLPETQEAWDDPDERALLDLTVGYLCKDKGSYELAEGLFRKALLGADTASWQRDLALTELERLQPIRAESCRTGAERKRFEAERSSFAKRAEAAIRAQKAQKEELRSCQRSHACDNEVELLEKLWRSNPLDSQYPVGIVFRLAQEGEWQKALEAYGRYADRRGRESANRLGMRLIHAQLLRLAGKPSEARAALQALRDGTADPWYGSLARVLLGEMPARMLEERGSATPADLVTLQTALGLQAEADQKPAQAIEHYLRALDSSLSNWYEFTLSKTRIERLQGRKGDEG